MSYCVFYTSVTVHLGQSWLAFLKLILFDHPILRFTVLVRHFRAHSQAAAQASAPRHSPSGVGSPGPVEIIPADPNANADGVVVRPWSQGSDFSKTRRRQLGRKMAELRPYNLVWLAHNLFGTWLFVIVIFVWFSVSVC